MIALSSIEYFNKNGFLIFSDFFPRSPLHAVAVELESHLNSNHCVPMPFRHSETARSIALDPQLGLVLRDLLGQIPCLFGGEYFVKPPGQAGFPLHFDNQSLMVEDWKNQITVWIAIDEVNDSNGPVEFLRGSHHSSHQLCLLSQRPGNRPDIPYLGVALTKEDVFEVVSPSLTCGSLIAFSGNLLHRSNPNKSSSTRRSIQLTFISRGVSANGGLYQKRIPIEFPIFSNQG